VKGRLACGVASAVLIASALASCGTPSAAPILLFNGTGTSPGDVGAIEAVLNSNGFGYSTASSWQLNGMNVSQMRAYRLIIVPGGNFVKIGDSLTSSTTANIREAVHNGLNYLGICAGAFFAGNSPYNGLNLTSDIRFGFYAAEMNGIRKTAVAIASAGGPTLDQYWEDGPQLTGWGNIVAKYPDGTPAIAEAGFGAGWVILSGVHPEAPEGWRSRLRFNTPASVDHAFAATLVRAALDRESLPHY
jgi:glutamine amidotransferase-like uncharacterized protein